MSRYLGGLAMAAVAALSVAAARRWETAAPVVGGEVPRIPAITGSPIAALDDSLAAAEDDLVSNDPFRVSNTPPSVRYDARAEQGAGVTAAATLSIRPSFVLKGMIGGPPWQAMIDGIPGQPPNTLIRDGARYDRLVVRSVSRDSVVVAGPDTTWVITFRRP